MHAKIAMTLGAMLYSTTALSAGSTLFDDVGPNTTSAAAVPLPQELITPFVLPSGPQLIHPTGYRQPQYANWPG